MAHLVVLLRRQEPRVAQRNIALDPCLRRGTRRLPHSSSSFAPFAASRENYGQKVCFEGVFRGEKLRTASHMNVKEGFVPAMYAETMDVGRPGDDVMGSPSYPIQSGIQL